MRYYAGTLFVQHAAQHKFKSFDEFVSSLPKASLSEWQNIGGQLVRSEDLEKTLANIKVGKVKTWEDIHNFYSTQAEKYNKEKLSHALAALKKVAGLTVSRSRVDDVRQLLQESIKTRQWMVDNIFQSREKDYTNPFRSMVYTNEEEMNKVVGSLDDNPFIQQEQAVLGQYKRQVNKLLKSFTSATKAPAKI
ncbi:MAG: DUF4954 family protein [Proteobacteria bacterium]|nr:MAG: DUF4954 family protein [Pseudomonadota bacterium]